MVVKSKKVCALSVALSSASAGLEDPLKEENCQLTHINGCDCKHIPIHHTHFMLCKRERLKVHVSASSTFLLFICLK